MIFTIDFRAKDWIQDNALDRADAAEEKVRQITEKLERTEEELRDTQKKMMQTENDLDKAQVSFSFLEINVWSVL